MKKKFSISVLIILSLSVSGQTNLIGFKSNLNWTNILFNSRLLCDCGIDGKSMLRFSTGLTYDHISSKNIIMGVEVLYEQRGFTGVETTINPPFNPPPVYLSDHYTYFSVPIKFGYNIGNRFWGFGNIGLTPAFLINAIEKETTIDSTWNPHDSIYNLTKSSHKLEIGGLIEIGCGYKFAKKLLVVSSFRLQQSFTSPDKGSEIFWRGMSWGFGIKYILTAKKNKTEPVIK